MRSRKPQYAVGQWALLSTRTPYRRYKKSPTFFCLGDTLGEKGLDCAQLEDIQTSKATELYTALPASQAAKMGSGPTQSGAKASTASISSRAIMARNPSNATASNSDATRSPFLAISQQIALTSNRSDSANKAGRWRLSHSSPSPINPTFNFMAVDYAAIKAPLTSSESHVSHISAAKTSFVFLYRALCNDLSRHTFPEIPIKAVRLTTRHSEESLQVVVIAFLRTARQNSSIKQLVGWKKSWKPSAKPVRASQPTGLPKIAQGKVSNVSN